MPCTTFTLSTTQPHSRKLDLSLDVLDALKAVAQHATAVNYLSNLQLQKLLNRAINRKGYNK